MNAQKLPKLGRSEPQHGSWRPWQLIAFRWLFLYLMLYSLDSFVEVLEVFDRLRDLCKPVSHTMTQAFAKAFLHVDVTTFSSYSDDTYNFVQCLMFAIAATISTVIWSIADRKSLDHNRLLSWLRVVMQVHVGGTVLSYGMAKVIPCQFPALDAIRLSQPIGEYSPHGLLWAVMGYAPLYTIFGGVTEVIGGFLLMLPATYLVGALLSFAVMVNVLMFNLAYDIGVKVLSFHLLLGAAVVFLPDLKGLLKLFFLQKPFSPASYAGLFGKQRFNKVAVIVQIIVAIVWLGDQTFANLNRYHRQYSVPSYAQDGIWIVEKQTIDGRDVSSADAANLRWGRLSFNNKKLVIQNTAGTRFVCAIEPEKALIPVRQGKVVVGTMTFVRSAVEPTHASIEGTFADRKLSCQLTAVSIRELPLTRRSFRWIEDSREE